MLMLGFEPTSGSLSDDERAPNDQYVNKIPTASHRIFSPEKEEYHYEQKYQHSLLGLHILGFNIKKKKKRSFSTEVLTSPVSPSSFISVPVFLEIK
jgi:hypothetical protein